MEMSEPSAVFAVPGPGFTTVSVNEDVIAVDFIDWLHRTPIDRPIASGG